MVAVSSIDELKDLKTKLETISQSKPELFQKWLHIVNLTRQFQFKYGYMGSLIMDLYAENTAPSNVKASVIDLYKAEVEKFKNDQNFILLKTIFDKFQSIGFTKISKLSLGQSPESMVGASIA